MHKLAERRRNIDNHDISRRHQQGQQNQQQHKPQEAAHRIPLSIRLPADYSLCRGSDNRDIDFKCIFQERVCHTAFLW